jgi:hypothetical protein
MKWVLRGGSSAWREGRALWWWQRREQVLFAATALLTMAGAIGWAAGGDGVATAVWVVAAVVGLAYSTGSVVAAVRHRRPSVDVIAWLALAGSLAVGEAFAGAVVAAPERVREVHGYGVEGVVDGRRVRLGKGGVDRRRDGVGLDAPGPPAGGPRWLAGGVRCGGRCAGRGAAA